MEIVPAEPEIFCSKPFTRETHISSFTHLDEFFKNDSTTANDGVDAAEEVLGDVNHLGSLGHAAVRHRESLVPKIRVSVVETNHERPRHEALEGLENKLGDGSELRHRAGRLAEDDFWKSDEHDVFGEDIKRLRIFNASAKYPSWFMSNAWRYEPRLKMTA